MADLGGNYYLPKKIIQSCGIKTFESDYQLFHLTRNHLTHLIHPCPTSHTDTVTRVSYLSVGPGSIIFCKTKYQNCFVPYNYFLCDHCEYSSSEVCAFYTQKFSNWLDFKVLLSHVFTTSIYYGLNVENSPNLSE